jgi:CBS domain-containing protein
VGQERSIKRLALARVADLQLDDGPVVAVDATVPDAQAVLARSGGGWLGLVDGDRFLGWVPGHEVEALATGAGGTLRSLTPQAPAAQVAPGSSLRQALEVILTARSANAVVRNDDGTFGGILSLEHIRAGLAR